MRPALANIITARVPEADLLIDTMTVRPQGNRAFLISDTIRRLKAADIWAKLDVLWMLAAHDAQAARLNWKAPASFALTAVNSPTFTADRGYAGNGTTSYLNTGWNLSTNGVNFQQNSACFGVWNQSPSGSNKVLFGIFDNVSQGTYTQDNGYQINQSAFNSSAALANATFHNLQRTASNAAQHYESGLSVSSASGASSAIISLTAFVGALNRNGSGGNYSAARIASAHAGGSLTADQNVAFYSVMRGYISQVGAA